MADTEMIAKVGADASGFTSGMKAAAGSTAILGTAVTALAGVFAGLAVVLTGVFIGGFFKMIGFVKAATFTYVDFENQLYRTSATMGNFIGDTEESAAAFQEVTGTIGKEIRDVAAASRFTATEVGEMAEVLALAGLSFDQMSRDGEGALEAMVDFAVVAGVGVEQAAGIGVASVSQFGREMADLKEITSVLTNTFTSSFVNVQQLGDAMRFFGPTAAAAGVSIEEAAAAIGAMGNAGIQGSMAGTGLRQAINKMIAPTDDARRSMNRLGLELAVLSPAGQAAKTGLDNTIITIEGLEAQLSGANMELKSLNAELNQLGMEQEKNNISIMKIKARAERQGRDLTKSELAQIDRLQMANKDLNLQQREGAFEAKVQEQAQAKLVEQLETEEAAYSNLKSTVENQTTGVISLVDIITQLNEKGATTAEILEMFGVRGGGAILALKGQSEAFRELAQANDDVAEAAQGGVFMTEQFVGTLEGTAQYAIDETKSKMEELNLVAGEPFAQLIKQEDGIMQTFQTAITKATENADVFQDMADSVEEEWLPALREFLKPENVETFMSALQALIPVIEAIGVILKFIADTITWILEKGQALADFLGLSEGGEGFMDGTGDRDGRLIGGEGQSRADSAKDIGKFGMAGAAIGSVIPGVGTMIGGGVGLGVGLGVEIGEAFVGHMEDSDFFNQTTITPAMGTAMAEGGIVTSPTLALIGEAGAEAVIPLDRAFGPGGGMGSTVINLTLDNISIGSGNAVTAMEVRNIVESQLPNIIRESLTRGARGVI